MKHPRRDSKNRYILLVLYFSFAIICIVAVILGNWPTKIVFGLFGLIPTIQLIGLLATTIRNVITAPRMKRFVESGCRLSHPNLLEAFNNPKKVSGAHSLKGRFSDRSQFTDNNYQLKIISLGNLELKSGSVVVADYLALCEAKTTHRDIEPLIDSFPKGEFPAEALVIHNDKIQGIAAVRIVFSSEAINYMEPAWTPSFLSKSMLNHTLSETNPVGGIAGRTAVLSKESYANFIADSRTDADFSPEPAIDAGRKDNPFGPGPQSGNPFDLVKETTFSDGSNMIVTHNGDLACECCPNSAHFYLAKNEHGQIQHLIIDFETFGQAEWVNY